MARLLIVDDEKMICEEFRETLEQEGYEVDCALDGKEGLNKIRSTEYNLVFLDASMPKMDGKKVLKHIRDISRVPVAFITGFLPVNKEKEILKMGALTCMQKPLDLDRVKSLIHGVTNQKNTA
ncbi:MAG TPA: response regulator [Candidatus Omnitrophota bacterium]|nr:response regulator [Candidatus Omnitrophota bacterium]